MSRLSIGQAATLACLLEVAAPKVGNVHRGADFDDCTLQDFLASGVAIGPVMERAVGRSLGATVSDALAATRRVSAANTNLGMILLLAPLAAVAHVPKVRWQSAVRQFLERVSDEDACQVFTAIAGTEPGGLAVGGEIPAELDVRNVPGTDLISAMGVAAPFDRVARQYVNGFADIFDEVLPLLLTDADHYDLPARIVWTQISLISRHGDSLIYRKRGQASFREAAARATGVLQSGPRGGELYQRALADFDFWLRSDGRGRNPGTTADLITAALFVGLRGGCIVPPFGAHNQGASR